MPLAALWSWHPLGLLAVMGKSWVADHLLPRPALVRHTPTWPPRSRHPTAPAAPQGGFLASRAPRLGLSFRPIRPASPTAAAPARTSPSPPSSVPDADPGRLRAQPAGVSARPRTARKLLRPAVSAVLIAAAFGFALPHVASYRSVWASVYAMSWPYALLVGTAATASMAAYWITIRAVLP